MRVKTVLLLAAVIIQASSSNVFAEDTNLTATILAEEKRPCYYAGLSYSHGSHLCQLNHHMRCHDGRWMQQSASCGASDLREYQKEEIERTIKLFEKE